MSRRASTRMGHQASQGGVVGNSIRRLHVCAVLAVLLVGTAADFEIGGFRVDTSPATSLRPLSRRMAWVASLGDLVWEGLGFESAAMVRQQWYVQLGRGISDEQLMALAQHSEVAFGWHVASHVHVVSAPRSKAHVLSGMPGVRWVGERPYEHKVDEHMRWLLRKPLEHDATQRHSMEDMEGDDEDTRHTIKGIIAVTEPAFMRPNATARGTAEKVALVCGEHFGERVRAWNVSEDHVYVSVVDLKGKGLGQVVDWLSRRSDVLWVEPRSTDQPMARFASKMMTMDTRGNGMSPLLSTTVLTSADERASVTCKAWGGGGGVVNGLFSVLINGKFAFRGNGTTDGELVSVAEGKTEARQVYSTDTAGNHTSGVSLQASDAISRLQASLVGMQLLVFFPSAPTTPTSRLITSYSAATRVVSVHPNIDATILSGYSYQIRPNIRPGDRVEVHANAASWEGEVAPTILRSQPLNTFARDNFGIRCPSPFGGNQGMPSFHNTMGFQPVQVSCQSNVGQTTTVSVASQTASSATCLSVCTSRDAEWAFNVAGITVKNVSTATFTGVVGSGTCQCRLSQTMGVIATMTMPQANPIWDRGITGAGQIIGLADTGVDYTNCLLSESPYASPPFGTPEASRRKVIAYKTTVDCAQCDGCPKIIPWDRMRFGIGAGSQVGLGQPAFYRSWPHACISPAHNLPAGCADADRDSRLEPRRYDKYGATLDLDVISKSAGAFEYTTFIRVYVFNRDDYDAYLAGSLDNEPNAAQCLNPNCATSASRIAYSGLALPPSRRGYGIIVRTAMEGGLLVQLTNGLPSADDVVAWQFSTASVACGDTEDDERGHGTLAASVAAGSLAAGAGTAGERALAGSYEGLAKDAKLFVTDMSAGAAGSDNFSIPLNLVSSIFDPAYAAGVRVHSNSWSCYFPQILCDGVKCTYTPTDWCNKYSTQAAAIDQYVFDKPDMIVLVAAGDAQAWAVAPATGTIRSPGTCKNCISVGSSHTWNEALQQSVPFQDAMDAMTAPLGGMSPLCPVIVSPPAVEWAGEQRRLGAPISATSSSPWDSDSRRQYSAYNGAFTGPSVPYLVEAACCNSTPGYNTALQVTLDGYTSQYESALSFGQFGKAAEIQRQIDGVKGKFFPCRSEPHCCGSGIENPSCCPSSYSATRLPWDPSSVNYATEVRKGAFDSHRLVDSSARGPPKDSEGLRIKPDFVAPGSWLVGANGRGAGGGPHCGLPGRRDNVFDESSSLVAMGGSSVATAVMAGTVALLRQYFVDGYYPKGVKTPSDSMPPTAALIKAVLVLASGSLADDEASSGVPQSLPDTNQGWGRPSLPRVMYFADQPTAQRVWYKDERIGFFVNDWVHSHEFLVDMASPNPTITVVLTYTDPQGAPGSSEVLVNDLDLNVTDGRTIAIVNNRACPIDPFTNGPVKGCNLPISDRANNVEKTTFVLPPWLKCTYVKATATEYKECASTGTYGALLRQERSTDPVSVFIKVRSFRIVKPCTGDGFFQECSTRKQAYSLAAQGNLLTRNGEVVPPIFSSYRGSFEEECVGNITLCAILEDEAQEAGLDLTGGADGRGPGLSVCLCVVLAASSLLFTWVYHTI